MSHPAQPGPERLTRMSRRQIERAPWPDVEGFEPERYPRDLRERSARQWWRRAREEYGSIHEFAALSHALTGARAPIDLLGGLARLITDEVRHAHLASAMAQALVPEVSELPEWAPPAAPFAPAPRLGEGGDAEALLRWSADVILCSCCIGETLSLPLYRALAMGITDPVPRSIVEQILRDERLHSIFGWEALELLLPSLSEASRSWLQARLAKRLGGFEKSCTGGISLAELAGREITIEPPGPDAPPNLGLMDNRVYAMIFYATIESEVLPGFERLGFDASAAWAQRSASP